MRDVARALMSIESPPDQTPPRSLQLSRYIRELRRYIASNEERHNRGELSADGMPDVSDGTAHDRWKCAGQHLVLKNEIHGILDPRVSISQP